MDPAAFENTWQMYSFSEGEEERSDKGPLKQDDFCQEHEADLRHDPKRVPYSDESSAVREIQQRKSIEASIILPSIKRQIDIFNSIMQHGILTKARANAIGIETINSADRDTSITDSLCLNYVVDDIGKLNCITHKAKGGLPVVLERENDPFGQRPIDDQEFLHELSERALNSMLFVFVVDDNRVGDPQITVIDKGNIEKKINIYVSDRPAYGCMETRANGSILPLNISYVILPDRLKLYQKDLKIDANKLIFAKTTYIERVPYNVNNQTKGYVTISCPDYVGELQKLGSGPLFTHMLRSPTEREL